MTPQCIQLRSRKTLRIAHRRLKHIILLNREEGIGDLNSATVIVIEGGCKDGRLTGRVELEMDIALWEENCSVIGEGIEDHRSGSCASLCNGDSAGRIGVLLKHQTSNEGAGDDCQDFVGSRMGVWNIETAGIDKPNGSADYRAMLVRTMNEKGEDFNIPDVPMRAGNLSTLAKLIEPPVGAE